MLTSAFIAANFGAFCYDQLKYTAHDEEGHQAAERNVISETRMPNMFGTPLDINTVHAIASAFVKSCPANNTALPVKVHPSLALLSGQPTAAGADIYLKPNEHKRVIFESSSSLV